MVSVKTMRCKMLFSDDYCNNKYRFLEYCTSIFSDDVFCNNLSIDYENIIDAKYTGYEVIIIILIVLFIVSFTMSLCH